MFELRLLDKGDNNYDPFNSFTSNSVLENISYLTKTLFSLESSHNIRVWTCMKYLSRGQQNQVQITKC